MNGINQPSKKCKEIPTSSDEYLHYYFAQVHQAWTSECK